MKMKKNKIILIIIMSILVILWGVCIYKLSDMNTTSSNGRSTDIITVFLEKGLEFTNDLGITNSHPSLSKIEHASSLLNSPLRKVMHASVYFVLAFFLIIVINMIFRNRRYLVSLLLTIVICFIFASSDEFHQTFVAGRTGQFQDVIIDTVGATFGCLFYATYYFAFKLGRLSGLKNKED